MYYLSLFRLPKKVGQHINQIQRRFFWGATNGGKGNNLISWRIVQTSKEQGGLGVGDIFVKNAALLYKWWWRFKDNKETLWKKIIKANSGDGRVDHLGSSNGKNQSNMWNQITNFSCFNSETQLVASTGMRYRVGNGAHTKFWVDLWIGEECLQKLFPRLYQISEQKEGYVREMGDWVRGMWKWDFRWRRKLFAWEENLGRELLCVVDRVTLSVNTRDERVWSFDGASFSVAKFVLQVSKMKTGADNPIQGGKLAWRKVAPPRAQIHLWFVLQGRLNTKERLYKQRVKGIQDDRCVLCQEEEETVEHLFFTCKISIGLWQFCCQQWAIYTCLPREPMACFVSWLGAPFRGFGKKIWISMFYVIVWTIWDIRNRMVFHNLVPNWEFEKKRLFWRVGIWIRGWCPQFPYSSEMILKKWKDVRKWKGPTQCSREREVP